MRSRYGEFIFNTKQTGNKPGINAATGNKVWNQTDIGEVMTEGIESR